MTEENPDPCKTWSAWRKITITVVHKAGLVKGTSKLAYQLFPRDDRFVLVRHKINNYGRRAIVKLQSLGRKMKTNVKQSKKLRTIVSHHSQN